MAPRVAIPLPHSANPDYCDRALPQYEHAVAMAGGESIRIPFDLTEARSLIAHCDAVLLPGSNADLDPAKFGAAGSPHTAASDPFRDSLDSLLLGDACLHRKPVLGICYGLQSLNVYLGGSLVQHIPDFLPELTRVKVNHEAGRSVAIAHSVEIFEGSYLGKILCGDNRSRLSSRAQSVSDSGEHGFSHAAAALEKEPSDSGETLLLPVNSSHHQSADRIGEGLRIVARCPDDNIIEAVEGTAPDHFVLAVQWHPERSVGQDAASRTIFRALIDAAKIRHQ